MSRAAWAAIAAGLAALIAVRGRRKPAQTQTGGPVDIPDRPKNEQPRPPIATGQPTDPQIADLLEEMRQAFEANGVDTSIFSAEEVTRLPMWGEIAIPPRDLWPRMAFTLREVAIPLRKAMGTALTARGYRPPEYNRAQKGSPGSRHQYFEALDLRPQPYTAANRRKLAILGADLHNRRGSDLRMGLGVYGAQTPSNIHIDTGFRRRTWRDAQAWKERASNA